MNLLVDIGHSRIKWSLHDGAHNTFISSGAMSYHDAELSELFFRYWDNLTDLKNVLIADVSGQRIGEACDRWFTENYHIETAYVETQCRAHGVRNAYQNPIQLGVDRWLAVIAGWHKFQNDKAAVCVVDCGTAITVDGISSVGQHLGGLILPGFNLMQASLLDRVQGIRRAVDSLDSVESNRSPLFFSDTTENGINNGCQFAVIATIDSIVTAMRHKFGKTIRCVLTGGDASLVYGLTKTRFEHDPDLVLRGLALYLADQA